MSKGNGAKKEVTRLVKIDSTRDTSPLRPMNDKQKEYINAINVYSVVICTGVLGSAKTYIPSVMAADMLLEKKIERVVIARPTEGKGKSIGYLPGDINAKLSMWAAPVLDTLKKRLGAGNFEAYLENGKIELLALESVKGRSWDDTFIIIDEAEDLDVSVARSLVGRQGIRSKLVVTGDIAQQDLKQSSGLQALLNVAHYAGMNVPHIDFNSWDYCVRSEEAKAWGMAFDDYEKEYGHLK